MPGRDSDPFGPIGRAILMNRQIALHDRQMKINEAVEQRKAAEWGKNNAKVSDVYNEVDSWSSGQGGGALGQTTGIGTYGQSPGGEFGMEQPSFSAPQANAGTMGGAEYEAALPGASGEAAGALGGAQAGGGMMGGMMGGMGGAEMGAGAAGGMDAMAMASSKKAKTNRRPQNDEESLGALDDTPVNKYRYKKETGLDDGKEHMHGYAEDLQKNAGVGNGAVVNLGDEIGVQHGAIRALSKRLGALEQKVA
jgi:hypothetical protein